MSKKRGNRPAGGKQKLEVESLDLPSAVRLAVQLHKGGFLLEAEELYRKILQTAPEHTDVLHFLGVLSHQLGKSDDAIDLIRKAIRLEPAHPDAYNNLGNVLKENGRTDEAVAAYREVIALKPEHAEAYNNLGIVLKQQGKLDEAAEAYREAISLNEQDAEAHHSLGHVLTRQGKHDEAESAYRKAIDRKPTHAVAHLNLGHVLKRQGKVEEAAAEYRKAASLEPSHTNAYLNLASTLSEIGQLDKAAAVFDEWLSLDPDNPVADHLKAACLGGAVPARASDSYIVKIFDRFADDFDEHLQSLEYRAPELVTRAVAREFPVADGSLEVLDAGCGTGLCGPLVRSYAKRLVGVDLSDGMLDKARVRKVYDELQAAELTEFLAAARGAYDLIISADTLVYFGSLATAFAAASTALRPGGRLVFTVERLGEDDERAADGFRLHHHGRYSHAESYLRRVLAAAELDVRSVENDTLRMESGSPVAGLVFTVKKAT